jgi:hypothetical protein
MIFRQLRDLMIFFDQDQNFSKIRQIGKFFLVKTNEYVLMILNDKPSCQVSKIIMNRRPIHVKTLRE